MTDNERWELFHLASTQYLLAFSPKAQIYFDDSTKRHTENYFIETIAYLTPEQKKQAIKDLGNILLNCKHDKEKFKSLVAKALASSEQMECIAFTMPFKKIIGQEMYHNEEEIDSAPIEEHSPDHFLYRDSSGQRRWYKKRKL